MNGTISGNKNQTVYIVDNAFVEPQVLILDNRYRLDRYTFEIIRKTESAWRNVGNIFLGISIGFIINMLGKIIAKQFFPDIVFDKWEFIAFCISILVTIFCYIVNACVSNEKESLKKQLLNISKIIEENGSIKSAAKF